MPARDLFQLYPTADQTGLVVQLNRILSTIAGELGRLEGLGNQTVRMRGDVDVRGNRVRGVGTAQDEGDAPSRGTVALQGALSRATQERVVVTQPIEAEAGIALPPAIYGSEAPSLSQVQDESTLVTVATAQSVSGQKTFTGGVKIGATGVTVSKILGASAVLDFPNTLAQTASDLTIAVTGADTTTMAVIALGVPNVSVMANSSYSAWVSAADTVTVRFLNAGILARDPPSGTFSVLVFQ